MNNLRTLGATLRRSLGRVSEPYILLPLFATISLGVIWGATFHVIGVERAAAEQIAKDSSRELAETYYAQMVRSIGAIDQTLKTVRYAYELNDNEMLLSELNEKGLLPSALVFTVGIADRKGNIVTSTRSRELENVSDQKYFEIHKGRDSDTPLVSPATLSSGSRQWRLHFSLRLNAPDGSFGGLAIVSVDPDYFTSGYERSRLGDNGLLGLLGSDNVFLASRTGEKVSWGQVLGDAAARSGTDQPGDQSMLSANAFDGVSRYMNVRRLYGFPLAVIVGLSADEQLAVFHRNKRAYLWEATGASALLLAIVAMLGRLSWQLAKNRLRTRKDQETYYAASDASLDAFFVLRVLRDAQGSIADFILDDTNNRGAQLFGTTKETLLGKSLSEAFPYSRFNGVFDDFVKVSQTGSVHEQEWENHEPALHAKWLYRQVVRVQDGVVAIVRDITERKQTEILRAEQSQVLEMIATSTPLEEVLDSLLRLIESQFAGTKGSILLLDEDGLHLRHGAAPQLPASYTQAIDGIPIGHRVGSFGAAIYRRERVIVTDILEDPLWNDYRALATRHGLRACWSTPIFSHEGKVLGSFALYSSDVHEPSVAEMQLVDGATRIAGIAIERKRTEDRIRYMAHHDALTGLPNRTLLEDRLEQGLLHAQRYGRQVTVVFIDLDNFKLVNDSLGHTAGDELLKTVADRMMQCVRRIDTVVRLGGDEFVIILSDQPDPNESVTATLKRLRDTIAQPVHIGGQKLQVTCSMGLATYPENGLSPDTILRNADAAMYRAKELGRNNYQFYTAEMNLKVHEKLVLQEGLRNALEGNEFLVLYQPQIDLKSGCIFGVEALIRWNHPALGMVFPGTFIPLAEETGLIVPIGDWVLRTACKQNKAWQNAGMPPITVSVNVSAHQFQDAELISKVTHALQESGLEARYLELEMTESLIMLDVRQAIKTMRELEAMGVQLSIDDFGTGYSSLSALKSFPIVRLKIDQSFVRHISNDPDDQAIATAVISLGHQLRLKVIAEGVETDEQLAFLRDHNCDEMQGYHFSEPVSPQEIQMLLERQMRHNQQLARRYV